MTAQNNVGASNLMKKILIIISALLIGAYLLMNRFPLLQKLEYHQAIANNQYFSKTLDLSKVNVTKFEIKRGDWSYDHGLANIVLAFNRPDVSKDDNYWNKDFKLKVKVNAYAIDENKISFPRLMKNYFMPSDEPMSEKTKLWAGWPDDTMEYKLGSIMRFPNEDLIIELSIETPDAILSKANPRIKIVGDYDSAATGYVNILKLVQYIFLTLCFGSLIILFFLSWKQAIKTED
jgi:hypothetical protein